MRQIRLDYLMAIGAAFVIFVASFTVHFIYVRLIESGWRSEALKTAQSKSDALAFMVQQDVLNGFYPNIVDKSQRLFEQREVLELKIVLSDGYEVFSESKQINVPAQDRLTVVSGITTPSGDLKAPKSFERIGVVSLGFRIDEINSEIRHQKSRVFSLLILIFFITSSAIFYLSRLVSTPINKLRQVAATGNIDRLANYSPGSRIWEVSELEAAFRRLGAQLQEYQNKLVESARQAAGLEVAHQVAHDIRSPLGALEVVARRAEGLEDDDRELLRLSVSRIRSIAGDILNQARGSDQIRQIWSTSLAEVVDHIVAERRIQQDLEGSPTIECTAYSEIYGLFVAIPAVDLRRGLSNLLKNAEEAVEGVRGRVGLTTDRKEGIAILTISDNGCGISLDNLNSLGKKGASFGKPGGSGLGIYHAKKLVESFEGSLVTKPNLGQGTEVSLSIPLAKAPAHFVGEIRVGPNQKICVIDDDPEVHARWRSRFPDLTFFDSPQEFLVGKWDLNSDFIALVDFNFKGSSTNGIDLIVSSIAVDKCILVTNQSDDPSVIQVCERNGIRILPKKMIEFIPIINSDTLLLV